MSKRAILLLVIVALAAGAGLLASRHAFGPATAAKPVVTSMTLLPEPRTLPAFSLQQSDGTPLTGDELTGHWTLVFLGFTHCPDVCPTTLAQLAGAQKRWAAMPEATRPRVLFVSADPERDSAELTGHYAHGFHVDTLAATAPIPQLQAFARSLSLVFMKSPGPSGKPDDYSIDHSAGFAVLDPQGRMAGVIQPPFDVAAIASDLATLSKATP
jgi:protein SCO1/2